MKVKSINSVVAVIVFVLIALTISIGVWWVSGSTYHAVFKEQKNAMQTMVNQSAKALDLYMGQTSDVVRIMAKGEPAREALELGDTGPIDGLLKSLINSSSDYWAAFLFDKNGKVVAGYNAKGKNMAGADRSSRGYVKKILSGTEFYIQDNILVSKSGGGILIFAIAHAVRDNSGKVVGGIGVFPKWERYTRSFIDPFRIGKDGYSFMLDNKGRIIAHAMNKDLYLKDLSKYDFVRTVLSEKNGGVAYDWEGRQKYMVFKTMPGTGWSIVVSAYEDDLTAAANHQRNVLLEGGLVVILLLSGIMVFILKTLVIKPVDSILAFSTEIAEGNLRAELKGTYRYEFENLADKINTMVAELKDKLGFSEGVLKGMTIPCAIVSPDLNMLWVNKEMCDLIETHLGANDAVGVNAGDYFWGDASKVTLSEKAFSEKKTLEVETEYTTHKGNLRNLKMSATPFYDMDGNLLGSITVGIDMTEIRQQAIEIEKQNERITVAAADAEQISQSLSSAAEELSAQIEQSNRGAQEQRDRVAETSTAMEEMNAT
ncbi:MAG: cache domain-containing protein, partial [Spirochaetales bacterium]|nr:cache domain-containing protein [Spirochaetales bacterium]